MKINDLNSLQEHIDKEIAWRKKELSWQSELVVTSKEKNREYVIRAAMLILYSHWEGTIKRVGEYYLCYVGCQNLKYKDLKHNFLGILLFKKHKNLSNSKKAKDYNSCILELIKEEKRYKNLYEVIPVKSNLNSEAFKNILELIGVSIEDEEIQLDDNLIDVVLLGTRNKIAHGERFENLNIDEERFLDISRKVLKIIETFCETIMNYAINQKYLKRI